MFELSISVTSKPLTIEVKCELKASAIADAFVTSLSGSLIYLTVAALLVVRELSSFTSLQVYIGSFLATSILSLK